MERNGLAAVPDADSPTCPVSVATTPGAGARSVALARLFCAVSTATCAELTLAYAPATSAGFGAATVFANDACAEASELSAFATALAPFSSAAGTACVVPTRPDVTASVTVASVVPACVSRDFDVDAGC